MPDHSGLADAAQINSPSVAVDKHHQLAKTIVDLDMLISQGDSLLARIRPQDAACPAPTEMSSPLLDYSLSELLEAAPAAIAGRQETLANLFRCIEQEIF